MENIQLLQTEIYKINRKLVSDAIILCYKDGITNSAPLGCSGPTIILFGTEKGGRKSLVSIRNYCGDSELLITDKVGNFLFYGRYDINLGFEFVVSEYWKIIKKFRKIIIKELEQHKISSNGIKIPENKFQDPEIFRLLWPSLLL